MADWFALLWHMFVWFLSIGGIPILIMAAYAAKEN